MLNNRYLKIFIVFFISYLISELSINNLFLVQSPMIDPNFVQNTQARINNKFIDVKNTMAINLDWLKFRPQNFVATNNSNNNYSKNSVNFSNEVENVLTATLKNVSPGVYAGEKDGVKIYEIRSGEVIYLEHTFNINGKEIKIKVPKGQDPPSQEMLNVIYK